MRPVDNLNKVENAGSKLGIITAYGLKADPERLNELVPADKFAGNSDVEGSSVIRAENKEPLGDGILETGESALVSVGDIVEVVGEEKGSDGAVKNYIIQFPGGRQYRINREDINIGYLDPTPENCRKFIDMTVGVPYSWGDKDGLNYDCSGFTSAYFRMFGICIGRGAMAQRYGSTLHREILLVERHPNEDSNFIKFLPRTIEDLKEMGVIPQKVKWGFTTISWGLM